MISRPPKNQSEAKELSASLQTAKKYSPADVPELVDILSQDQETRLKAGRKLVERVDVEQALTLPHRYKFCITLRQDRPFF